MRGRPFFLFAPGAGAPSTSPWMKAWRQRIATVGDVEAFDYPYMLAGRKSPDRPPVLIAAHEAALAAVRSKAHGPLFLIGKSMGGRIGCHVAAAPDAAGIAGVVCLGYPLRSGSTGALRDEVLLALRLPVLFVQGSRDPLCPLADLESVRRRMKAESTLLVVDGGNHSLELPASARKGTGQADSDARVLEAIRAFASRADGTVGAAGTRAKR
jgi:predicted alpha/beta-hydrolase family hydrolase